MLCVSIPINSESGGSESGKRRAAQAIIIFERKTLWLQLCLKCVGNSLFLAVCETFICLLLVLIFTVTLIALNNNFTIKACVYVLPVFNIGEKLKFQCRIVIFSILNVTGHWLLLLFILHICVFPRDNSFSLLKMDCCLTGFSGQYASSTSAKFCLFWMLKKSSKLQNIFLIHRM